MTTQAEGQTTVQTQPLVKITEMDHIVLRVRDVEASLRFYMTDILPTITDVAGIPVTTTAATEYEDGTAADLALDVRIEVEGTFDANGVLVADEIEFENDGEIRVHALVDSVDVRHHEADVDA